MTVISLAYLYPQADPRDFNLRRLILGRAEMSQMKPRSLRWHLYSTKRFLSVMV